MASQHSLACCTIPPVVSEGYEPKGEYITIDGLKTYRTGPADAKHAILIVFDIFGFFPQTLQGADILATSDKDRKYQVFIPDFFEGNPADISWYPPDNEEKGKKLGAFFAGPAAPAKTVSRIPKVVDEINSKNSGISSWGILGFCWGGKVTNLSSTEGTKFKAAVSAHPAMVDPADAPKVTIPYLMLPSKDEDKEAVKAWQQGLKVKNHVELFDDQIHGFMAARSNLSDARVKEEYTRGYKTVLSWFHENLNGLPSKI
ncbi:Dienelactone hydrolase [Lasiodiplodia theobromae]|uniref:Dienelactone hydrolase n=1 Tax=Lasiodiplodia theobromae TaxID=45133 RepID=UPI0015C2D4F4|nr:Dienelactone hydrolase [Lasiodiplodia theobromae]KAF4537507.1 Dienelactone hydrolase [Lasiodiplodia theobromae]